MKKFCLLLAVGIFLMSGAALAAYQDGTLLKERNGTGIYEIKNGRKTPIPDASVIGGRKVIEVSPAEFSQIPDMPLQSYKSVNIQPYGAAQNGQVVKSYALPGNAAIGTTPMPSMAIGGVITPATLSSHTTLPSPSAITTKSNATTEQLRVAKEAASFAIMSNNVYGKEQLPLPGGWERISDKELSFENKTSGFYSETYVRRESGQAKEVVIVFRGTDEKLKDVPNVDKQVKDALLYSLQVLKVIKGWGQVKITATGHSLGGTLAQYVSGEIPNRIDAVVFNSAPYNELLGGGSGKITRINEKGDILDPARIVGPSTEYDLTPQGSSKFEEHSIYNLARGMAELAGLSSAQGNISKTLNTKNVNQWESFASDLSKELLKTDKGEGLKKLGEFLGSKAGVKLFEKVAEKLPDSMAKSFIEKGPLHLARIMEREASKAFTKNVGMSDVGELVLGVVIESLVEHVRINWNPQGADYGPSSLNLNSAEQEKEGAVFAIREAAVAYAYATQELQGHPIVAKWSAVVAQAEVTGTTIYEVAVAGVEVLKQHKEVGNLQKQNATGELFLKLRSKFKAEKDVGKKKEILAKIDTLLSGEGSFLFTGDMENRRKNYIGNLARNAGLQYLASVQQNQVKANAETTKPAQKAEFTAQPMTSISHAPDIPVKPSVQPPAYAMPTKKAPMNGGATANMMSANAAQYDLANCLGPELKRKISMPISSRDEFLQLEKEVMAEAKKICGNGTQQQSVASVQNHVQPVQPSVTSAQANNQAVISNDIATLAARNDCVQHLAPGAKQKLKAIPTNIDPTDYMSRQHAILNELYRNCGIGTQQQGVASTQQPSMQQNQVKAYTETAKPAQKVGPDSQSIVPISYASTSVYDGPKNVHAEDEYKKVAIMLFNGANNAPKIGIDKIKYAYNIWKQPFCKAATENVLTVQDDINKRENWHCDPHEDTHYGGLGHTGIDIHTNNNAPNYPNNEFYAVSSGVVIRGKENPGDYNTIAIWDDHRNITTLYLHAKQVYVKKGDKVVVGQPLGVQGNQSAPGGSEGTHVHFGARPGQRLTDLNPIDSSNNKINDSIDPIAVAMEYFAPSYTQQIQSPKANAAQINNASVQTPMQPALQPVMQAANPSQRVVAPLVATVSVQPQPANMRPNAPLPVAAAQAQQVALQPPPQTPQIQAVNPNTIVGSNVLQPILLVGNNFQRGMKVTVGYSGGRVTLQDAHVEVLSPNQARISINTQTTSDNWTVQVANPNGSPSNVGTFRVVAPIVVTASAQPHAQATVQPQALFQAPPANIRPNALLPIAVAQAQPIAPPQKALIPTSALQFNGFASNYSTTSTPYQPTISLSGSGFNSVTQISWTCAMPNGASCGAMSPWTSTNWNGKFIRYNDTSAVVAPMLLVSTDPKGTYHWTATFYGAGQPVIRSFAVDRN